MFNNNQGSLHVNLEKETLENNNYRKVIYTNPGGMQLVLMSLKIGQDIGSEVHHDIDQFIRVEKGNALAIINNIKYELNDGYSIMIPKGSNHNIINTGNTELKLYTIYSPPEHKHGKTELIKGQEIINNQIGGFFNNKYYLSK